MIPTNKFFLQSFDQSKFLNYLSVSFFLVSCQSYIDTHGFCKLKRMTGIQSFEVLPTMTFFDMHINIW